MISLNKLLMGVVLVTVVVIKAEDTTKSEVVTQENEIYASVKDWYKKATSQENIDTAKDYTNTALEQTEKVFTQYPMYIPAAFFFGRASMAAKAVNLENLPKDLVKKMRRIKTRNMYVGAGLLAGHFYYNRHENEKTAAVNPVVSKSNIFSNNIEA